MLDALASRSGGVRFASLCLRPPLRGQFPPLVAYLVGLSAGCHHGADVSIKVEQFERHAALPTTTNGSYQTSLLHEYQVDLSIRGNRSLDPVMTSNGIKKPAGEGGPKVQVR